MRKVHTVNQYHQVGKEEAIKLEEEEVAEGRGIKETKKMLCGVKK